MNSTLKHLDEADRHYIRMRYEQQIERMMEELSKRDVRLGKRFKQIEVAIAQKDRAIARMMRKIGLLEAEILNQSEWFRTNNNEGTTDGETEKNTTDPLA